MSFALDVIDMKKIYIFLIFLYIALCISRFPISDPAGSLEPLPIQDDDNKRGEIDEIRFEVSFMKQPSRYPHDPHKNLKWDMLSSGAIGIYSIIVTNTGLINDTIELVLNDPGPGWDWFFITSENRFMEANLSFSEEYSNHSVTFDILVETSSDHVEGDSNYLNIYGKSRTAKNIYETNITESDQLYLEIGERRLLEMRFEDEEYYLPPGGSVVCRLNVKYIGYKEWGNILIQKIDGLTSGFSIEYPDTAIRINWSKSVWMSLKITAVEGLQIGYGLHANIILVDENESYLRESIMINTSILVIHDFDSSISNYPPSYLYKGESSSMSFWIHNHGNLDDTIRTEISGLYSEELDFIFMIEDEETSPEFPLKPDQNLTVTLKILVDEDAACQSHIFLTLDLIGNGCNRSLNFSVRIYPWSEIEIEPEFNLTDGPIDHFLGGIGRFLCCIRVFGDLLYYTTVDIETQHNWEAWIEWVSLSNEPEGEGKTFISDHHSNPSDVVLNELTESRHTFEYNKSNMRIDYFPSGIDVWICIRYQAHVPENDPYPILAPININATGSIPWVRGFTRSDEIEFQVQLKCPDPAFTSEIRVSNGSSTVNNGTVGDELEFMNSIINNGYPCPLNVSVQLWINDVLNETIFIDLNSIEEGECRDVIFHWTAVEGNYLVEIKIDFDDMIFESGMDGDHEKAESNNRIDTVILIDEVRESERSVNLVTPIIIMISSIVMMLIVLTVIFLIIRNRKISIRETINNEDTNDAENIDRTVDEDYSHDDLYGAN